MREEIVRDWFGREVRYCTKHRRQMSASLTGPLLCYSCQSEEENLFEKKVVLAQGVPAPLKKNLKIFVETLGSRLITPASHKECDDLLQLGRNYLLTTTSHGLTFNTKAHTSLELEVALGPFDHKTVLCLYRHEIHC